MVFDRGKIIKYSNICTSEVLELERPTGVTCHGLEWLGTPGFGVLVRGGEGEHMYLPEPILFIPCAEPSRAVQV